MSDFTKGVQEPFEASILERIQATPSYLLLLFLWKQADELSLSEAHLLKNSRILINFFVRRNLTEVPATRDLTRIFMSRVEDIEEKNLSGDPFLTRSVSD